MKKLLKLFSIFIFTLLLGCGDNDSESNQDPQGDTIYQIALNDPNLSKFVEALGLSNSTLVSLLGPSTGPYTVLIPTNDAFDAFFGNTPLNQVDSQTLKQILKNHIIIDEVSVENLYNASNSQGLSYLRTFSVSSGLEQNLDLSLLVDTNGPLPKFNNTANIVSSNQSDIRATNGIVHVVDAILDIPTIADHISFNSSLSSLSNAVSSEPWVSDRLNDNIPLFFFAPSNNAFTSFSNPNNNDMDQILFNHTIGFNALVFASPNRYFKSYATSSNGENLSINIKSEGEEIILNGDAIIISEAIKAINGSIYIVDKVIDLPTIHSLLTANESSSSLLTALQIADSGSTTIPWIDTISDVGSGPFTLFAPDNVAFDNLLLELDPSGNTTLNDLDNSFLDSALLYHVINQNLQITDLPVGTTTTLGGDIVIDNANYILFDQQNRISNINEEFRDIQGVNGVIHIVDNVLLPPLD